ncbi:MAG TPA: hypothetical protein VEC38_07970 [Candidatus Binataceae bacterium]|nr:hypothetical protein [Candidatus Binataceae bacterium]
MTLHEIGTYQPLSPKWFGNTVEQAVRFSRGTRVLSLLWCLTIGSVLAPSARAQEATPVSTPAISPQDLAKSVHNPFEDFVKVPLQAAIGFRIGPEHNAGESINLEPLFPFRLTSQWDLIVQPNQSMIYLPSPHEQFGLNDLQTAFYFTPHGASEWIWGIGPIFEFPTATGKQLGTGRWSAGPTGAIVYSNGPWFAGVLANHLMSFAGDRKRGSVNSTYIEPEVSYNLESGWYAQIDPQISCDWTADASDAWVVPIGADIGKAFNIGSQSVSLQIGSYDFIKRPEGGAQWMIRAQLTLLFPSGWPGRR